MGKGVVRTPSLISSEEEEDCRTEEVTITTTLPTQSYRPKQKLNGTRK